MLQELIKKIESQKGWYDKSYYNGIDLAIEFMKDALPDFEECIKKAYSDGQINVVNIIRKGLPQLPLTKTIEEIRKITDGEEPNEGAQDYYNQNYNPNDKE